MSSISGGLRPVFRASLIFAVAFTFFQADSVKARAFDGKYDSKSDDESTSEVVFGDLRAEFVGDGTRLTWTTSYERGVLGFNIRRVTGDGRSLVNSLLVAGAVTKVANGVLDAGDSYRYLDRKFYLGATYEIEAVFLDGGSKVVGPIYAETGFFSGGLESQSRGDIDTDSSYATFQSDGVDTSQIFRKTEFFQFGSADAVGNDGAALKFEVRQAGWYRVPASVMQSNGFPMSASGTWKMYRDGREIAIKVNSDGSVEFYGLGIDTFQSDTAVYWLTYGSGNGQRVARSTQKYSSSAPTGWTRMISERRDKAMRMAGVINGARENWFAAYVSATDTVSTLNLTAIATESGETATVGIDLQGIGSTSHSVAVILNGSEIGRIAFSSYQRAEWSATVPLSALRAGINEIRLRSSSTSDYSLLEAVRISYPKRIVAESDRMQFTLASRKSVKLLGFSSPQVRVFDTTNPDTVTEINPATRLEANGTYSATISSASASRILVAQADTLPFPAVAAIVRNSASNLRSTSNQANLLLLAPAGFHSDLQILKNARESQGLRTMIVDPTDIYDEFSNGVVSSDAVRSFLQFAHESWSVKPDFAIFVGEASTDPRNYTGRGGQAVNLVPTMFVDTWNIEAVSDPMLADFDGDNLEDIYLGRLPVRTNAELNAVLTKILAHDATTNQQILNRGALMVSDANIGYNFENASRNIAQTIPSTTGVSYADVSTADPTVFRQNLLNTMNAGPAVVNYFGHGSVTFWTNNQVYRTGDATALTNYSQPSLAVMLACLNGTFAEPFVESLSEATIKTPTGGAFGVWAASGWNGAYEEELMGRDFLRRVYSGIPIGAAVRQSKAQFPTVDLRRTFIYFGDPSQRLIR